MQREVDQSQELPSRFAILASAITSRRLSVAGTDGGAAYTDGQTIYVDRGASAIDARDAVAVHAALLAAGSLSRPRLLKLSRYRRAVAERYLCLEVIRCGSDPTGILPPATVRRIREMAAQPLTDSSDRSLKRAVGGATVPPLPSWVGTLKVIKLLRKGGFNAGGEPADGDLDGQELSEQQDDELSEDEEEDSERSKIMEMFSSPLSSPLSDAIKKMLGMGRSESTEGDGGMELKIGGERVGPVGSKGKRTRLSRTIASLFEAAPAVGHRYPEWDDNKDTYRQDWCAVAEYDPPDPEIDDESDAVVGVASLRRPLARVGIEHERHRRQPDGDSLDVSALVDYVTSRQLGDSPEPRVYEQTLSTKRELSVLVLLDATGSTNEESDGQPIFERERLLAGELTASLDDLGDRVAAYGFYSRGKDSVRFLRIKGFGDLFDTAAKRRLRAVTPTGFTRLGAALRHGTHLLQSQALAKNMILVLIGDGLPYDDGYENTYARADTRQAIQEAVRAGVGVVGLAIRSSTEPEIHEDIWSDVPFRVIADIEDARRHLRPLLLDALRMTRSNGRRRDLATAGDHAEMQSWMAKGRKSNSYV
jgi:nitric oxide reductase NorD protein